MNFIKVILDNSSINTKGIGKEPFKPNKKEFLKLYKKYTTKEITATTFKKELHNRCDIIGCVSNNQSIVDCDTCPIFDWCQAEKGYEQIKMGAVTKAVKELNKNKGKK